MCMNIYFDTCALNRLTDRSSQPRVRDEAESVEHILAAVAVGHLQWNASSVLRFELANNPDPVKRAETSALLLFVGSDLQLSPQTESRALSLQSEGLGASDALHLALCEAGNVDALLTVDDRFLRRGTQLAISSRLQVANPVNWWARRGTWQRDP